MIKCQLYKTEMHRQPQNIGTLPDIAAEWATRAVGKRLKDWNVVHACSLRGCQYFVILLYKSGYLTDMGYNVSDKYYLQEHS